MIGNVIAIVSATTGAACLVSLGDGTGKSYAGAVAVVIVLGILILAACFIMHAKQSARTQAAEG